MSSDELTIKIQLETKTKKSPLTLNEIKQPVANAMKNFTGLYLQVFNCRAIFKIACSRKCRQIHYAHA